MFSKYYQLTKPGIIYGNLITTIAGFLLASRGHVNFSLLLFTLLGTSFVIASACVFNNYIDRDIDKIMDRTKKRATATGDITKKQVMTYGSVLGVVGFLILIIHVNWRVTLIGAIGWFLYVFVYTKYKRTTVHSTLIGAIPGATPPLAGYVAVANHIDTASILLFLLLFFWQMAHFYSIAVFRREDYAAAKIPVISVVKGIGPTKFQIQLYIAAFGIAAAMLTLTAYTGFTYLLVILIISIMWFRRSTRPFSPRNDVIWAKNLFKFSLITILVVSLMLSIDYFLP